MPRRNLPTRHGAARKAGSAGRGGRGTDEQDVGGLSGGERAESWRGLEYRVRPVAGSVSAAGKPYRCPGCDQLLPPGLGHLVAWPADDLDASGRRHWHTACWRARDRRAPGVQRSRNAPRYG